MYTLTRVFDIEKWTLSSNQSNELYNGMGNAILFQEVRRKNTIPYQNMFNNKTTRHEMDFKILQFMFKH